MDTKITLKLQKMKEDSNLSISIVESFYEELTKESLIDDKEFNCFLSELKNICVNVGIDHTRYSLRSVDNRSQKNIIPKKSILEKFGQKSQIDETSIQTISMNSIWSFLSSSYLFLSNCIIKIDGTTVSSSERLIILYSDPFDDYSEYPNLIPDMVLSLEKFSCDLLDPKFTWIILILFHSSMRTCHEKIDDILNKIPNSKNIKYFDKCDYKNSEENFWKKSKDTLIKCGTFYNNPCVLVDDRLNAEYETLVKKFFGEKGKFLVYSYLDGGFSGSKVLLVSSAGGIGDKRKYVLKIAPKTDTKLKNEYDNYRDFVALYWIEDQVITAEWQETLNYHAIRYPFASEDTISHSISFAKKYSECDNSQTMKALINRIFDHKLQVKWRLKTNIKAKSELFSKIFESIFKIEKTKIEFEKILRYNLVNKKLSKFEELQILKKTIKYIECINHGDFHSDNIQVQDGPNSVFLIDFGLTNRYPAGLDYASLEASIRYKLLDHSIDSEILKSEDLAKISNFDSLISLENNFESDLDKATKTISTIRQKFLNDFAEHAQIDELKSQYLYCLLALCLRKICYSDLNRRFVLLTIESLIEVLGN
jgi:hypothetical protein